MNINSLLKKISNQYITHVKVDDWGYSILIMEIQGKSFGRVYWYNDDPDAIYLDWLSVDESCRKDGLGTRMQEIRERIGRSIGAKWAILMVLDKNSWLYAWYLKRGYQDYSTHEQEENVIWMRKSLDSVPISSY